MPLYALGDAEPDIHPTAYVHPDAVVIGNVTLGPESTVWPTAVLRGDDGRIEVGARSSIQDGSIIHTTLEQPTIIGDEVTVGHNVHIEAATIGNRLGTAYWGVPSFRRSGIVPPAVDLRERRLVL